MNLYAEQERLEREQHDQARIKTLNNYQSMVGMGKGEHTPEGISLQKLGVKRLVLSIKEYLSAPLRGRAAQRRKPLMYYKGKEEELSYLLMQALVSELLGGSAPAQTLIRALVGRIKKAMLLESFATEQPKLNAYLEYEYRKRGQDYILSRKDKLAQLLVETELEEITPHQQGVALMEVIVNANMGIIERFTRGTHKGMKSMYYYRLTEQAREMIEQLQDFIIRSNVTYKPLVLEPVDWSDEEAGGYHHVKSTSIIKFKTQKQRTIYKQMLDKGECDLSRFYDVVNTAQRTAWRINSKLFDIVKRITNGNIRDYSKAQHNFKCIAGIPYQEHIKVDDLVKPEQFGEVETTEKGRLKHKNRDDYKRYFAAREELLGKLEANNSRRIMYAIALDLAEEFSKYDKFYFSYKADFRGRIYPVQQVLNPQSTGNAKALLEFAEGHVPDERGIYWLKIAVANAAGHDKLSYDDRIKWVDENIKEINEAAEDALSHVSFWSDTDEPLMFLAGCMALSDGLKGKEVHYPIPLDATCSGIQMYSGLLLDEEGARAVNVVNNGTGKPSDIYQDVADVVERRLKSGDYPKEFTFTDSSGKFREVRTNVEAEGLKGKITRKLTKRNVMTQPYSVTQRGMFNQLRELFDEYEDNDEVFWKGEKWVTIKLLTHLNTQSIYEVVKGAIVGQEYIKDLTKVFNVSRKPLVWKTPFFNFPVIQAAVRKKTTRINSPLGQLKFNLFTGEIDAKRQSSSIAPNYIHSLDATLMFLTVERLAKIGVTDFALVHDSFAVPCNQVDNLNDAVRYSYIELFASNPLEHWYQQLQQQTAEELQHPDTVLIGTLNLSDVINSDYIFS